MTHEQLENTCDDLGGFDSFLSYLEIKQKPLFMSITSGTNIFRFDVTPVFRTIYNQLVEEKFSEFLTKLEIEEISEKDIDKFIIDAFGSDKVVLSANIGKFNYSKDITDNVRDIYRKCYKYMDYDIHNMIEESLQKASSKKEDSNEQ